MNRILAFCWLLLMIYTQGSFAKTVTVNITGFQFKSASIIIDIGDIVKWSNQDPVTHTTTSTSPPGLWDKTLTAGATFSRAFKQAGVFSYHCSIHPTMTGTITVRTPDQTRVNIGKQIITSKTVPITLNLAGKNPDLVYLGSYIVNAQSGCANCHSCPTYATGHNPYLGQPKQFKASSYLAGGVPFLGGGLLSANITPNPVSHLPAGLTLNEFKTLFRTGHDPDVPGSILQIMPWPFFGMMSDHDLEAIHTYLSCIPSRSMPPAGSCTSFGQ